MHSSPPRVLALRIQNFQSVVDQTIELRPGLLTVTGPSNLGKSSVVRAFNSLLFNDSSLSYVRRGAQFYRLTMTFEPGSPEQLERIVFTKGSQVNEYVLTYADGRSESFPRTGINVPPPVEALGFSKLATDRTSYNLNVTTQLEPLFLVAHSEVNNTSLMNAVFGTDRYERGQRDLTADLTRLQSDYNRRAERHREEEDELEAMREEHETLSRRCEDLGEALEAYRGRSGERESLEAMERQLAWEREAVERASADLRSSKSLRGKLRDLGRKTARYKKEREMRDRWERLREDLSNLRRDLRKAGLRRGILKAQEEYGRATAARAMWDSVRSRRAEAAEDRDRWRGRSEAQSGMAEVLRNYAAWVDLDRRRSEGRERGEAGRSDLERARSLKSDLAGHKSGTVLTRLCETCPFLEIGA